MEEKKPSEIIADFLGLVEKSHADYLEAKQLVEDYNSHTYDWTHRLEDAPNKNERNKLATAWQNELKDRRKQKDRMALNEALHKFSEETLNKSFLKRLSKVAELQRKTEEYIKTPYKDREYNERGRYGNA